MHNKVLRQSKKGYYRVIGPRAAAIGTLSHWSKHTGYSLGLLTQTLLVLEHLSSLEMLLFLKITY